MGYIQANTDGRLHSAAEPSISPLNRGFLYGDAVYEVWRTYDGVVFAWEEHLARMRESARAIHMELGLDPAVLFTEIRRTVAEYRKCTSSTAELYIRLQVSRGSGAIGLDTSLADKPSFTLLVQDCPALTAKQLSEGLRLSVARQLRRNPVEALNPGWKTGNYLNNLLCLREAKSRGADEVLMLNLRGEVTECAVSNIAFVKDNRVVTPPLSSGILAGITRGLLLGKVARSAGVEMVEQVLTPDDFAGVRECFIISTTKDIVPVASIDDVSFPVSAESITARLKKAFGHYAREYAHSHPELVP
jgi:branched-chain amino acid aminotransferase